MTPQSVLAQGSFTVDPWDPGYGLAYSDELDGGALGESSAQLDLDLEMPADRWRPVDPDPTASLPGTLLFLDGVRRIDARIWVHGGSQQPAPGIAASFAAGLVCCNSVARVAEVTVQRGLFTAAPEAADIATRHGRYPARPAHTGGLAHTGGPTQRASSGLDQLSLALQQGLAEAEVQLAVLFRARQPGGDDLLVVDGPLRGRTHLERTVGYIKTHHASYLPAAQAAVVASLAPGQRTPVFTMGTSWRRNSWYLRLPGGAARGARARPGLVWYGLNVPRISRPRTPRGSPTSPPGCSRRYPARRTRIPAPRRTSSRSAGSNENCATGSATSDCCTVHSAPPPVPDTRAPWAGGRRCPMTHAGRRVARLPTRAIEPTSRSVAVDVPLRVARDPYGTSTSPPAAPATRGPTRRQDQLRLGTRMAPGCQIPRRSICAVAVDSWRLS